MKETEDDPVHAHMYDQFNDPNYQKYTVVP